MAVDDELSALRRRLYAPDATDADRDAFAAAEAEAARASLPPASAAVDVPLPPVAPAPAARPARWRRAAVGAVVLVGIAGAVVVAVGHPFAPGPVTGSPSPALSVIGSIPVSAATRAGFLRALDAGRDPGLDAYLQTHPAALLAAMRVAGRTDTTGISGVGPATLNVAPTISQPSGHITLVLVTEHSVHFQWTANTVAYENDRSGPVPPVAIDDGAAVAGEPVAGTVAYSGGVPSQLTILLPDGVHWGGVVVYTG